MPAKNSFISDARPQAAGNLSDLYERSRAAQFGISSHEFSTLLDEVLRKNLPAASSDERNGFYARLHIEDLVLSRACAEGNQRAWELFMLQFREKLYDAARQITRDDSAGRELADSVYADLYGTRSRDGKRVSKLLSYSGRGSLVGWLRTVLAQEFVNHYRKQRRLVSLDRETEEGAQFPAPASVSATTADERLEFAVDQALQALEAEDRFILASYFLDERTLAEIARVLGVHESTISRKVEKLTKALRKQIFKALLSLGMSRRQAEEALTTDVRDIRLDIRTSLAQDSVRRAFSNKEAKAGEGGT